MPFVEEVGLVLWTDITTTSFHYWGSAFCIL